MTEDSPRVLYETRDEGRIALLSMNRERYRNPLSQQMMSELTGAFERAEEDSDVRVIVLRGLGAAFSAGHDLGSPDTRDRGDDWQNRSVAERYAGSHTLDLKSLLYFREIPKPTIAMVHGTCIYAGWMLASSMDLVFAAEDTRFLATNFTYFAVSWDIGARRAKHLLYEARFINAREAMEAGFVSEVHPLDQLESATLAYAGRVAENDPFQMMLAKHSINQMQEMQGFTAHIRASFSDAHVRYANTRPDALGAGADPAKRRLGNVERARQRPGAPGSGSKA